MTREKVPADLSSSGLYFRDVCKYQPLASSDEARLAARIRGGDQSAVEVLVKANLRFVTSVAKAYQNQGVPLMDLISEGNAGLVRAALKFDERKNFRFISYAVWWVRQAILTALAEQSRMMRLPQTRVHTIYLAGKTRRRLEQQLGRRPGVEEIAAEGGIRKQALLDTWQVSQPCVSLHAPTGDDGRSTLAELLPDNNAAAPDSAADSDALRWAAREVLAKLCAREREVVTLYYGLGREAESTLDDIGRHMGITRERVRQLRDQALKRLRRLAPSRVREVLGS
jgi:RNA polymerase primary sigma factor